MQKFTQRYCLVTFLEKVDVGFEYSYTEWPLHTTIADVFAIPIKNAELITQLAVLFEKQKSFTATAAKVEYFGPEKQVQVTLLDMNKMLIMLHRNVINSLKNSGAVFNDPRYIEEGFRAHATVQPHVRLHTGDLVDIAVISLVDMYPNKDGYQRKVLENFRLYK